MPDSQMEQMTPSTNTNQRGSETSPFFLALFFLHGFPRISTKRQRVLSPDSHRGTRTRPRRQRIGSPDLHENTRIGSDKQRVRSPDFFTPTHGTARNGKELDFQKKTHGHDRGGKELGFRFFPYGFPRVYTEKQRI